MLMLNFSAAQHLCTALFERQRVGVPRIVHIQHGGAVAVDGDGFGLVRVVGEMLIVAAFKALVLIIAAALLRTGCNIGGRERSSYAVADVIGYPQTLHQTCIVHLIRASTSFVSHKDRAAETA